VLHLAVMENRLDVVELAVREFGRTVTETDRWGNGLRAWARVFRSPEVDGYLEQQGAEMPEKVSLYLGKAHISLSALQLTSHFTSPPTSNLLSPHLPLKHFLRIYKTAAYALLSSLDLGCAYTTPALAYAVRKGFVQGRKEAFQAFLLFFTVERDMKSFGKVVELIPEKIVDSYINPVLGAYNAHPYVLLEQFADRLTPEFALKVAKSLGIKGYKGAREHLRSQEAYAVLPALLQPSTFKAVTESLTLPTHCYGNFTSCWLLPHIIALFNTSNPSEFQASLPSKMPTLLLSCLHPNGCLEVFNFLEERGVLPKEKVSMRQAKVNFVVNVDMVKYHKLVNERFCDFKGEFSLEMISKAHKETLVAAFRLFEREYGWRFMHKLRGKAAKLGEIAIHCKGIPRLFLYYLEEKCAISTFLPSQPVISSLKRYKALLRYSKVRKVLFFLYLRSQIPRYQRLSQGLSRYLSGFF